MFSAGHHSHPLLRGNESYHLQIRNENREYYKKCKFSIFCYILSVYINPLNYAIIEHLSYGSAVAGRA